MTLRKIIYFAILTTLGVACQQMPQRIDNGRVIATVDGRVLRLGDVVASLPEGVRGVDSLSFVDLFVERWIARQVKVREAERLFSSSVEEVEAMVESYRMALLTHKLDQYYIDSSKEAPFTDYDIRKYYSVNMNNFRLDGAIVKGYLLRMPKDYSDKSKLTTLMKSTSDDSRLDLLSLSERSGGEVEFLELTSSWIGYDEFMAMLPIVRGSSSDKYLKRNGVQSLEDASSTYLFEFTGYRSAGYVAPLEIVESQIRRILTNEYQQELIRSNEEKLIRMATKERVIKRHYKDEQMVEVEE